MRALLYFLYLVILVSQVVLANEERENKKSPYVAESAFISVLSQNVWMIPLQGQLQRERAKIIGKQLKKFDIVFLQEVFTPAVLNEFRKHAGNDQELYHSEFKHIILGSGLVGVTGYELVRGRFYPFKGNCTGWQCLADKGVMFMRLKLPDDKLIDVYFTHLDPYADVHEMRTKQLQLIRRIIDENEKGYATIFAGDLNFLTRSEEYKKTMEMFPEFKDAWLEKSNLDRGLSWDPVKNSWAKAHEGEKNQRRRLDYILLKDGNNLKWSVEKSRLEFNKKSKYDKDEEAIYASDHFGVSADLILSPAQQDLMAKECTLGVDANTYEFLQQVKTVINLRGKRYEYLPSDKFKRTNWRPSEFLEILHAKGYNLSKHTGPEIEFILSLDVGGHTYKAAVTELKLSMGRKRKFIAKKDKTIEGTHYCSVSAVLRRDGKYIARKAKAATAKGRETNYKGHCSRIISETVSALPDCTISARSLASQMSTNRGVESLRSVDTKQISINSKTRAQ